MPNSYEHSYQHDLDNVIDASDAVLAIGTEKVDITTLKDRSLNNNDATIHGAMPSSGYFLGRQFTAANSNYLDCGNDSSLDITNELTVVVLTSPNVAQTTSIIGKVNTHSMRQISGSIWRFFAYIDGGYRAFDSGSPVIIGKKQLIGFTYNSNTRKGIVYFNGNGGTETTLSGLTSYNIVSNNNQVRIARQVIGVDSYSDSITYLSIIIDGVLSNLQHKNIYNSLARLPLYSHNFERYPNSDTSLTSVFPYTSGIITSGSFNKTDGLKCTSAGQIIFSNSFEFDGSEYITLIIGGVEYSGTTTLTQGTITATIAQGSNDITIDMGTNDVLEDIRVQFRAEV